MELEPIPPVLKRKSFPDGFIFGAASAAYQYEGAPLEDGKKASIWDIFTHDHPERIKDHKTGDVADDSYHRYKEDIAILKKIGLDAYRFSISWSRILPDGKLSGGVNPKGVKHYSDFIDELIANDIVPFVTLFHWDLPQALEAEGGFLNDEIVGYFRDFAEVCFEKFGNRVKHWITLNEPYSYSYFGYITGHNAPGQINIPSWNSEFTLPPSRYSWWQPTPTPSSSGDASGKIPYMVTHHQILAHLAAVEVYRNKFQKKQGGIIGITLVTNWMKPYDDSTTDHTARQRGLDFMFGWFMNPITYGDYPDSMKTHAGDRLPLFQQDQKDRLKMSYDFLGLNYYTSNYASAMPNDIMYAKYYIPDSRVLHQSKRDGKDIGPKYDSTWIYCCPDGLRDLLKHIKEQYNDPVIYITENGIDEPNRDKTVTVPEALVDYNRVEYHYLHLSALKEAINAGVNVKGYFIWSLLDNFEWNSGYTSRFGINYVDYKDGLKRYQKLSGIWFKIMLEKEDKNSTKSLEN